MTEPAKERIAFDVETSRILGILSSEIYDSPKAFLRENVQNAYDAILMRCTAQNLPVSERSIVISVEQGRLTVRDDGIGMTEEVLKENFWKAGSSGKKTELAQKSGVIGTFGIGAMANFGVCTALRVETRHIDSEVTFISAARRDDLKIGQDCIDLERVSDEREPGTTVIADLDPANLIDEDATCEYLKQYVSFLPVPVLVNGKLISQQSFEETLAGRAEGFELVSSRQVAGGAFSGALHVSINGQARLLARLTDIVLNGAALKGDVFLVQGGGPTHGFRNLFGLAPIPVSGQYGLGGFVNLDILHPTAGREALSRESIQHVSSLVDLIEREASRDIAGTASADENQQFQQYILAHGLIDLATNVRIAVLPASKSIPLSEIASYEPQKGKLYYVGHDATVLKQFASDETNLFHVAQANPRRKLQVRYVTQIAKLQEVPDTVIVEKIRESALTFEEAMFLVRLRGTLLDDYLMPDVDIYFATISHGVHFHVKKEADIVHIAIARNTPAAKMVLECYTSARDVFDGFMKDFVREHIYPRIKDYVPSSTKQGRDALYKRLIENKELFRLRESDFGEIESVLSDYLAGKAEFADVLRTSASRSSVQRQHVGRDQVGSVEEELPDILTGGGGGAGNAFDPVPPLTREDIKTDMKVLTVSDDQPKLNNFRMFLALSDRVAKREGDFLRWPHTTKLIWGAHRVIYIFTDATGGLSLYYDIELRTPLDTEQTGGNMFPTTTVVTKNRIFVPVPKELEAAFLITEGDKEFYVRFDTIP